MAKQPFVFCNGPHQGPCPNRIVRLVIDLRKQGALSSAGKAADVLRQIVDLGRGDEDVRCAAGKGGRCPHGADKPSSPPTPCRWNDD